MYRSSFLLFRKFYRYYVIGTLIIFSLKFMNESDLFNDIGVDVAYFSLWTYLAYSTCVSILSPEADEHPSDAACHTDEARIWERCPTQPVLAGGGDECKQVML